MPDPTNEIVEALGPTERVIAIGDAYSLKLVGSDGLKTLRAEYSSHSDRDDTGWNESWIPIGVDGLGDPLFVDADSSGLPVFSAQHGRGSWEPEATNGSLTSFAMTVEVLQSAASQFEQHVESRNPKGLKNWLKTVRASIRAIEPIKRYGYWATVLDGIAEEVDDLVEELRPLTKKEQAIKDAADFVEGVLYPVLRKDSRFDDVVAGGHVDGKGLVVAGKVGSKQDSDDLHALLDRTEPPMKVFWKLSQ